RAVVSVAPGDVIAVLDEADARIVAIFPARDLSILAGVGGDELDALRINRPADAILAETCVKLHRPPRVVAAKHAGELSVERHDRTVEDAICGWKDIARNDGIGAVAPDDARVSRRTILPRNIGQRRA